jgi:hypothetical protein
MRALSAVVIVIIMCVGASQDPQGSEPPARILVGGSPLVYTGRWGTMELVLSVVGLAPGSPYRVVVELLHGADAGNARPESRRVLQHAERVFTANRPSSELAIPLPLPDPHQSHFLFAIGVWDAHPGPSSRQTPIARRELAASLSYAPRTRGPAWSRHSRTTGSRCSRFSQPGPMPPTTGAGDGSVAASEKAAKAEAAATEEVEGEIAETAVAAEEREQRELVLGDGATPNETGQVTGEAAAEATEEEDLHGDLHPTVSIGINSFPLVRMGVPGEVDLTVDIIGAIPGVLLREEEEEGGG